MSVERCGRGASFADLVDYWAGDLTGADAAQLEAHLFECAECAKYLEEVVALGHAIGEGMRGAHFQSIVTDSVLNRLSRDGVRIRSYAFEPGQTIPCSVWPDDDLVVSRLRADLTGYTNVGLVLAREDGVEMSRIVDIPIGPETTEIIDAVPAARLRAVPSCRLRLVLSGTREGREQVIAEYGLEHTGTETR
ncbi:MAG TPA: zf-HC2 domain-containing protein [Vicinamibacterales bacterium]|nr:zf-HC2 domain-containing protein [Vicinamibacterales bacterium]